VDPRPVAEIDLLPVMPLPVQHCEPGLVGMVGMAGINGHIPWCRHLTESANFNYKNGKDVLGLRVAEIAKMVKSQKDCVTILCWNSECDKECDKNVSNKVIYILYSC